MSVDDDLLATALQPDRLRQLAGKRSFERGEDYLADGAVRALHREGNSIKARVEGTRIYHVRLWLERGEIGYDCTCPFGQEGNFCKHCVVVGLATIQGVAGSADEISDTGESDLRSYLLGLTKEDLACLVLDQAEQDDRLRRKLTLQAAQAKGPPAHRSEWKTAFSAALDTGGDYVRYGEAFDYASEIEEVIDSLDEVLAQGRAECVVELAEHGLEELEEHIGAVDDSDGYIGGLLQKLQTLHLEACRIARPDPKALAERLFEWEMETEYDTFWRAVESYADILGEEGLAVYRRLAEAEWAKIRPLGPGEDDANRYGSRFRIASIMEALARADGDVEALAAIKRHDLSHPYDFLKLAELYHEAGMPDLALEWAEKGWRAFPPNAQDARLRAFLADAYQDHGRHEDALALAWDAFSTSASIDTYRLLEKHGKRARRWTEWREKALPFVRNQLQEPEDHSVLVEIFLHEGDIEAAWREANAGGCAQHLWLRLATRWEKSHPSDAIKVYREEVARLLRYASDSVYAEAVRHLEKMHALHARLDDDDAFRAYVSEIRTVQRRKRNLMKLLDQKGW